MSDVWMCVLCAASNAPTALNCGSCGATPTAGATSLSMLAAPPSEEEHLDPLSVLPLPFFLDLLALLSLTERLLLTPVSRSWRAAVRTPFLWETIHLALSSEPYHSTQPLLYNLDAVLAAVVEKSAGKLKQLSVEVKFEEDVGHEDAARPREEQPYGGGGCVSVAAVLEALERAGPSLRHLKVLCPPLHWDPKYEDPYADPYCPPPDVLRSLLEAAPASLLKLESDADCYATEAQALVFRTGPFGKLHLRRLCLRGTVTEPDEDAASFTNLFPGLATHTSLKELVLDGSFLSTPAVLSSFIDLAITIGITALRLSFCGLDPRSMVQLARLLTHGQLSYLYVTVTNDEPPLFDMANERPAFDTFCAALRSNTSIQDLSLERAGIWDELPIGDAICSALVGHSSIQHLNLRRNGAEHDDRLAVGTILARLVTTNSPCLRYLDLSDCGLGDDGVRPIINALLCNTHLHTLDCSYNGCTPDVRHNTTAFTSNTSLQKLKVDF